MVHLRGAVWGGLLASLLVLAGCSTPMMSDPVALTSSLRSTSEVPPTASNGSGSMQAQLDRQTQQLSWSIVYGGLTGPVTAAHFHGPAMVGQNAGVVVPILGNLESPMQGAALLTSDQAAQLLAGQWYVNLHTSANPGGEIRGQVVVSP